MRFSIPEYMYGGETKMSHNIFVKAYVEMRNKKYNPDGTLKDSYTSAKAADTQKSTNASTSD